MKKRKAVTVAQEERHGPSKNRRQSERAGKPAIADANAVELDDRNLDDVSAGIAVGPGIFRYSADYYPER